MSEYSLPLGEFLLYETEDSRTRVECRFIYDTLWLTQALMAELFQKDIRTINEHLQNIYDEQELEPEATIRKFRIVRQEGNRQVNRTETTQFFKVIRNKLHFAVTGKTAAELIRERADSSRPNMGLTTSKSGKVQACRSLAILQELGGCSSYLMAQRYAHIAPEHLTDPATKWYRCKIGCYR